MCGGEGMRGLDDKKRAKWLKNRRNHTRNARLCLFCECSKCQVDWLIRNGNKIAYRDASDLNFLTTTTGGTTNVL